MQQIVGTSYYGEGKFAGEGDLSSGGFNEVELWVIFILCMFVYSWAAHSYLISYYTV